MMIAHAATPPTLTQRLWHRLRHESSLAILFPSTQRLFSRYERFQHLELRIFLYNTFLVVLVLALNRAFLLWAFPSIAGQGSMSSAHYMVLMYFEGLFRYVVWTMANMRMIAKFRRSFDASIYMTGTVPGLQMALFFARPFFLASIAGSLLYSLVYRSGGLMMSFEMQALYAFVSGGNITSRPVHLHIGFLFMHEIMLGLFRAAAVAYALFGGLDLARSAVRAFFGYAAGAFFLFVFTYYGEIAAMHALNQWLSAHNSPFRGVGQGYSVTVHMYFRQVYLLPYYATTIIGAEFFLWRLRQQGIRGADDAFERL